MTTMHIAPDLGRSAKGHETPEQVLASIVDGINTGNLDALLTLYESDAAFTPTEGELLWATPGSLIRQMPTSRVTLTVNVRRANGRRIGEYALDHTAR